ncbi:MAG: 50S ribosomal protein L11 methyltransferase [Lachnospiraceae bacterium]|nr:50S ribosomal protein L11 methyltransferase [Lachnospiraceae bacterium]
MKWNKYVISTTTEAVDLISAMLMEKGIDGIEINDNIQLSEKERKEMYIDFLPELPPDMGLATVTFYTEDMSEDTSECDEEQLISDIKNELESLSAFVNIGAGSIDKTETEDKDWINNWKAFFKAFTVDDIVIKPTWEPIKPEYDGKILIEIDPGTAFGTGMHETTQLVIRQMKKYITDDTVVLDAGCGSGILSIIGAKLGAKSCTCVDIDVNATDATVENMKVNGVDDGFYKVITGNVLEDDKICDEIGYDCYDMVVANILADVVIPLTAKVPAQLKKGGIYITSGIINTKEEEVVKTIEENPYFEIIEITRQNDWSSVTARRV